MPSDIDRGIAELAAQQHGLFTRLQVLRLGGDDDSTARRVATGAWTVVHPGVYRLPGNPRTWRQSLLAAVLAAGPGTAVAIHAAAALHGLPSFPRCTPILTSIHGSHHRVAGAVVHQSRALGPEDITLVDRIPTTTVERTLFDLAAYLGRRRLGAAVDDAVVGRLVTVKRLRETTDRLAKRGRRGSRLMRSIVDERGPGWQPTESELERLFLEVLRKGGVRPPRRQRPFPSRDGRPGRLDYTDDPEQIIWELDSRRWHTRVEDFERDRRRDREANLAGWITYRITWFDLLHDPEGVCETVREARRIRRVA